MYSSYLGGSGSDAGDAIAADAAGNAYVTGATDSSDFPVANPLMSSMRGRGAAFVTKLSPDGSSLIYSTYLGGTHVDQGLAIAVDNSGNAFVTGQTDSVDFPLAAPVQASCRRDRNGACTQDAFVTVLNPAGALIEFSTYLGGTGADSGRGIAVDAQGSVYVAGSSTSQDFPLGRWAVPASGANQLAGSSSVNVASTRSPGGAFASKISGLNFANSRTGAAPKFAPPGPKNPTVCPPNATFWLGGTGNWSTAADWNTNSVPNSATTDVCIDNGNNVNSVVTLDVTVNVRTLTIDAGDTLIISDGQQLDVNGNISNSGQITLAAASAQTFLRIVGAVSLTGSGTVTLTTSGVGPAIIDQVGGSNPTLTNVGNTIQGQGLIGGNGLALVNQAAGIINANVPGKAMQLIPNGTVTNAGLLEATNGGVLDINGAVWNNAGGTFLSSGSGSNVEFLNNPTIQGGTLNTAGGGILGALTGQLVTFDGSTASGQVNNNGTLTATDNTQAFLLGTINNTGAIQLNAVNNQVLLRVVGAVTLTGSGTVTLSTSGAGQAIIDQGGGANPTLTNVNNLIHGQGQIGTNSMGLVNQAAGVINADVMGQLLNVISITGVLTNQGLLEATGGATLGLDAITVNNSGANIISSGSGSAVEFLASAVIQGGTLNNPGGGLLEVVTGNIVTLDGSTQGTLNNKGTLTAADNTQTVLSGTINNSGAIQLNAVNNQVLLRIFGAVILTGSGTVTLSSSGNGQAIIDQVGGANPTLTNVNNLIQGQGQLGNNGLALVNQTAGVINANVPGKVLDLNGIPGVFTNRGLLEATNGATLGVDGITVNDSGTKILSDGSGSIVEFLNNPVIQGGALATSNSGAMQVVSGQIVNLDGTTQGTLTIQGTFTAFDNTQIDLSGTINNTGAIQLNAVNNQVLLRIFGAVSLTGSGTVTLSTSGIGQAIIDQVGGSNPTLTNVNNILQGQGQIGNNGLALINQGTIIANAANPLTINPASTNNQGLLEATGNGVLQFSSNIILNGSGTIKVNASTASVQFVNNVTIQGGTLANANGGVLGVVAGNIVALDGSTSSGPVTINGTYTAADNTQTDLFGTIINSGAIQLSAVSNQVLLRIVGAVSLTGSGTVTLSTSGAGQSIIDQVGGINPTLTNVNNTLQGQGQIGNNGLALINQGTIIANAANPLTLNPASTNNQGLLEATAGGVLQFANTTIVNGSGTIKVNANTSSIQFLNNTTIQGGTLATANGGVLGVVSNNIFTLDGSTASGPVNNTGTFVAADLTQTNLLGTINNTGAIQLNAANNQTLLRVVGAVSLTGTGSVTLSTSGSGLAIIDQLGGSNPTLTNVGNTIQGQGQIGNNGLALVNQGIINASLPGLTLTVNPAATSNQGTLEATGGGVLSLASNTISNNGGTIATSGAASSVQFVNNVVIQSGTLTSAGGGKIGSASGNTITLDGTANPVSIGAGGTYTVGNNSTTNIQGTINILGTLLLNSSGSATNLTIPASQTATLTGGGNLIMTNNSANIISGPSLFNSGGAINEIATFNVASYTQSSGTFLLAPSATATNTTFAVNGGTAQIDGSVSASNAVSASGSGILSGVGTITGPVTMNGITQAGDIPAPGILHIAGGSGGSYTQGAAGSLDVPIGGTSAGSQFSQLTVSGTAALAGTLNVSLINGFTPVLGDQFVILNASSVVGQFATVNTPPLSGGLIFTVTQTANSVTLNVTSNVPNFQLTVSLAGAGAGTVTSDKGGINCPAVSCSASFPQGTVVTLAAVANNGSTFTGWSACSGTGTCPVTMNSAQTVIATFVPNFLLTVGLAGNGTGSVTSDKGGINCPAVSCSTSFTQGTVVTLTAVANNTSTFAGWSAPCSGTGTCVVTMNSAQTATATFTLGNQPLTLGPAPGTSTSVTTSPGNTAVFPIILTSNGFTGTVTLSCASPQSSITCGVTPSKVQVVSNAPTQTAASVNTFCAWTAPPGTLPTIPFSPLFAVVPALAGLALLVLSLAAKRQRRLGIALAMLALVAMMGAGCGSLAKGPAGRTPPGTYTLIITATPSTGLPSNISLTLNVL
ncbi:MAG: SBBP repeat-containing protein [Candidatus Acidiferrales bacterium]